MGNALKDQGKSEEAIEAYRKVVSIKPDYSGAYYNMGVTLKEQGKLEKQKLIKKSICKPDYAEARITWV